MLGYFYLLCLGFSSGLENEFFELGQHVGSNCGLTNVYDIAFVNISPWPPTPGGKSTVYMEGTFLQTTYVQEEILGTMYNGMILNYQSVDIDKSYQAGTVELFVMLVEFPNEAGTYTSSIQLNAGTHICCWQFQYNIN